MKPASKSRSHNGVKRVIVRQKPGVKTQCLVRIGSLTFKGALGRSGRTIFKREGDGATPIKPMRCLSSRYKHRHKLRAQTKLAMLPISENMGWCDEADHATYNRAVKLPFSPSHETMLRDDVLYDFVIVLDWNITSRKRHCGSAIFFHVAKPGYPPTQGCIAISRQDMMRLLPLIDNKTVIKVV
ncbi:MAG: L,D-transpeptidase family protein [Lentilitoribacter sp.]